MAQTASISGVIRGDDGKSLAAVVTANRTSPPGAGGSAQAAADGAFTIPNLPAGTYVLCAAVDSLGYLDPCIWASQPTKVPLAAGQTAKNINLVVERGDMLRVHVNDPDKVLPAAPQKGAPHLLLVLVTPRRLMQMLQLVSVVANFGSAALLSANPDHGPGPVIPWWNTQPPFYVHTNTGSAQESDQPPS